MWRVINSTRCNIEKPNPKSRVLRMPRTINSASDIRKHLLLRYLPLGNISNQEIVWMDMYEDSDVYVTKSLKTIRKLHIMGKPRYTICAHRYINDYQAKDLSVLFWDVMFLLEIAFSRATLPSNNKNSSNWK